MRPAVLFDLDGVLADSRATITSCLRDALADCGLAAPSQDVLETFIGPPAHAWLGELMKSPPEGPRVAAVINAYRARYREMLALTPAFPGIPEAVSGLAGRFRLAVATSKPAPLAESVLRATGLRGHFGAVVGPALGAVAHTKSQTLGEALTAIGGGAFAMVGDTRFDVIAAREHGLAAVGVLWGMGDAEELEAAGADVVVGRPGDLAAELDALLVMANEPGASGA